jgi:DNA-binding transcriptional ArsR family regulator
LHASIHVYVNDDRNVSMWQDEAVENEQPSAGAAVTADSAPAEFKTVADVDMLRAMADPIRIAILGVLMNGRQDLPVMSVKELAARLGEPQTKLYRHMRQLEEAGLIRVAATRLVSGILEQRYQACQRDVQFDGGFLRAHADESEAAMTAMLDGFRRGFFAAFRDERLAPDAVPEAEEYLRPTILASDIRVGPSRAAEIRSRVRELMTWLEAQQAEESDAIQVNVMIGYYAAVPPDQA